MVSIVSICNMALLKIGATRITDLSSANRNSQLCSELIYPTIDEILRLHPWNCASARATLARLSKAPAFGFTHQYTLPAAPYCLRALQINEDPTKVFKIEGRILLTDYGSVNLKYIKRINNPTEFDSLVISAIATKLAFHLALPITQSSSIKKDMKEELRLILLEARSADSQEGTPDVISTSTWLESRL